MVQTLLAAWMHCCLVTRNALGAAVAADRPTGVHLSYAAEQAAWATRFATSVVHWRHCEPETQCWQFLVGNERGETRARSIG